MGCAQHYLLGDMEWYTIGPRLFNRAAELVWRDPEERDDADIMQKASGVCLGRIREPDLDR